MYRGVVDLFKIQHMVIGMTIFMKFPFTRLVNVWSGRFEYFTRRYQVVRSRR
ncbi:respiratory nitrate reductase subunit gamma [Enterobacter mori]